MNECLFCKIVKKEIPSEIIYEDSQVLVFLDINPTTNGDTLIIPKEHYLDISKVPDELNLHILEIINKLYPVYKEKLKCDGLTLTTNLEYAEEVKHYHVHFIPRYKDDGVKYLSNKEILKDLKEIKDVLTK